MDGSIFQCGNHTDFNYERNGFYMSASDKKKLRKEQYTEKMTKKQKEQRSEARKLKAYSTTFIVLMVAIVLVLGVTFGYKWYTQSGFKEKHTIAATIGDYEMNTVEMSYYYNDAVNNFYSEIANSTYGQIYLESLGLDITQPLDQQTNPETGDTWANYFIDSALDTAKSDFALYNLAMEEGFTLSEDQQTQFDSQLVMMEINSEVYGGIDNYLSQIYGSGANLKSYKTYMERREIANAYYTHYMETLSYTDEDIEAYIGDNAISYTSFSYAYAYLSYKDFLEGGTEKEDGTKEYSEDENNAARQKMTEAAEYLLDATSVDELKEMINNVEVNESSALAVNTETNKLYSSITGQSEALAAWLSDEARTEGEIGTVEVAAKVEEGEDEAEAPINGIYVLIFLGSDDNNKPMNNVRHILIQPEGGHTDESTGETVYTEAELHQAYIEAEALLDSWKNGAATEDSFIELVKEHSADTASVADGGLYKDIHPQSEYMEGFLNWAIDPTREIGDTGIVETPYGQHIMFYVGPSETTYRNYMVAEEMKTADMETWYNGARDAVVVTKLDLSRLDTALIIAG